MYRIFFSKIKLTWDYQSVTVTTKKKVDVTGLNLPQLIHSSEVTEKFHLIDKTRGTRYDIVLGMGFQQGIGMDIMNGALDFRWDEVQVPMVDMGYWNDTTIDKYQWHRYMVEPEEYHTQAQILDTNDEKPDLEEINENQPHLFQKHNIQPKNTIFKYKRI